jgi:hypothetical protein
LKDDIDKAAILPNMTYKFNKIPPNCILCKNEKNPKIHLEFQGIYDSQNNLGKEKNKVGNLTLCNFKTYTKLK